MKRFDIFHWDMLHIWSTAWGGLLNQGLILTPKDLLVLIVNLFFIQDSKSDKYQVKHSTSKGIQQKSGGIIFHLCIIPQILLRLCGLCFIFSFCIFTSHFPSYRVKERHWILSIYLLWTLKYFYRIHYICFSLTLIPPPPPSLCRDCIYEDKW